MKNGWMPRLLSSSPSRKIWEKWMSSIRQTYQVAGKQRTIHFVLSKVSVISLLDSVWNDIHNSFHYYHKCVIISSDIGCIFFREYSLSEQWIKTRNKSTEKDTQILQQLDKGRASLHEGKWQTHLCMNSMNLKNYYIRHVKSPKISTKKQMFRIKAQYVIMGVW